MNELPKELAESNSRFVEPIPGVMLGCMDPAARDLMETALADYKKAVADIRKTNKKYRQNVYGFAYWLFRWSGLIDASGKARTT